MVLPVAAIGPARWSWLAFFDAIVDDAEKIFLAGDWPKIPDIYSVPKEYGYADAKEKRPGLS